VTGNPYPGLRTFEKDDAHLFFGREKQVQELVALLARHRFLAVVGVSGSGKSSPVKAGLPPALHLGAMGEEFLD
jgi:ABC-type Mn2+/Zn2+ transport system ATPase subunit